MALRCKPSGSRTHGGPGRHTKFQGKNAGGTPALRSNLRQKLPGVPMQTIGTQDTAKAAAVRSNLMQRLPGFPMQTIGTQNARKAPALR